MADRAKTAARRAVAEDGVVKEDGGGCVGLVGGLLVKNWLGEGGSGEKKGEKYQIHGSAEDEDEV